MDELLGKDYNLKIDFQLYTPHLIRSKGNKNDILILKNNKKKTNNLIKKWAKDLNGYHIKNIEIANKHVKRWPTSDIIREMQIKTTL